MADFYHSCNVSGRYTPQIRRCTGGHGSSMRAALSFERGKQIEKPAPLVLYSVLLPANCEFCFLFLSCTNEWDENRHSEQVKVKRARIQGGEIASPGAVTDGGVNLPRCDDDLSPPRRSQAR